jgi:hypothetical protein
MNNSYNGKNLFGISRYGSSGLFVDLLTNQSISGIKRFLSNLITNSNVNFNTTANIGRIVFKPNENPGFGGNLISIYTTDENNGSGWFFDADGNFYLLNISQRVFFDSIGNINANGTITGGNLSAGTGTISTTGNISGGSLFVGSGNVTGGAANFTTGNFSSNVNITGATNGLIISGGFSGLFCNKIESQSGGAIVSSAVFNLRSALAITNITLDPLNTLRLKINGITGTNSYLFFNNSNTLGFFNTSSGTNTYTITDTGVLNCNSIQTVSNGIIECNTFSAFTTNTYKNKIEMTNLYANPSVGEIDIISQYIGVVNPANTLSTSAKYGFFRTFSDGNTDFDINNISGAVWGTNWSSRLFYTDFTFQCQKSSFVSGYRYNKFMNGATEIGSISMFSSSEVRFNQTSDYRLKQDIVKIHDPLERCLKLKPKNYRFIKNIENSDFRISEGFIAHEVQDILPSAVSGEKDDPHNFQMIDYSSFTPLLTGAIQELNDKVEIQQKLIDTLIKRLEILENK